MTDKVRSPKEEAIIKELRRLVLAIDSFAQCRDLAEYLRHPTTRIGESARSAALAGITSTYGKNFNSANKIGSLGTRFCSFDDVRLQVAHDNLLEFRNTRHSHRDADFNYHQLSDGSMESFPVEVRVTSDGQILFQPKLIEIPKERLGDIISLMDYQTSRAQSELDKRVEHLVFPDTVYSEETVYLLGRNFP